MDRFMDPNVVLPASVLLRHARAASGDLSQTELAQAAGVTQAALSRYESGLREPSLAELGRIISHTDYRLVVDLHHEPRPDPGASWYESSTGELGETMAALPRLPESYAVTFPQRASALARRLPEGLCLFSGELEESVHDGPTVEEALLYLTQVRELARATTAPRGRLKYLPPLDWDSPQERIAMEVQDVGTAAEHAAFVLTCLVARLSQAQEAPRRRGRKPADSPRLGRRVWAHIVCSVRAEAGICLRAGQSLSAHDSPAGERYIAAELNELRDRALALYARLAAEPAFRAWRDECPPAYAYDIDAPRKDEQSAAWLTNFTELDPLYDAWLDGELEHLSAPPPLFTDSAMLLRYSLGLAKVHRLRGRTAEARLHSRTVPWPETSEPTVFDRNGMRWKISILTRVDDRLDATPSSPAYVTASCCNHFDVVYVLAADVHPQQTAAKIAAMPSLRLHSIAGHLAR